MESSIKISIIIPAYNVGKYIEKCISSLFEQTYQHIEIVAVDDGSIDETGIILDELSLLDDRITVIHQKNGGASKARNTGLDIASGEYIMFLDADDWLEQDCCEKAIKKIEEENAELLFFDYYKEFKNKKIPMSSYHNSSLIYEKKGKQEFDIYNMRTVTPWGKLYDKKIIAKNRFDESLKTAEDVEFNYRIYDLVNKAVYINEKLLHYRVLENSAVHGYDSNMHVKLAKSLDKLDKWKLKDESHIKPYYSFKAIAYILICQNEICLDSGKSWKQKVKAIKDLKNNVRYADLFHNVENVKLPITRKMLIVFGKWNWYFAVFVIVSLKLKFEKRG